MGDGGVLSDADLRAELEGDVALLLERHLAKAKEWFPHEFREPTDAASLVPDAQPAGLVDALFVNLLTEDNLPAYTSEIDQWFGREGAWATWTRRWTAEEGRHSIAMREWIHATQLIDPYALERARMATVLAGVDDQGIGAAEALVYVTIQELATRVSHANTGRLIPDEVGRKLMQRIVVDENLHFLFYRDVVEALLRRLPSHGVIAVESVVRAFHMPGIGIPGFHDRAAAIANAGIYSWSTHLDDVLTPIVRHLRIDELTGLTPDAEAARDRLFRYLDRLARVASRLGARANPVGQPA